MEGRKLSLLLVTLLLFLLLPLFASAAIVTISPVLSSDTNAIAEQVKWTKLFSP